jgi:peptide-methionine (S)-S-oxide reductase
VQWNVLTASAIDNDVSTAVFAAGCFWGVEAAFREIPGVTATTVGYTGGRVASPSYHQVCSGRTGHAEAVQVEFDPAKVSYAQLLDTFWASHDPTTRNRQGWDIGSQYRSAIFFEGAEQEAVATASLKAHQGDRRKPIVTEITQASAFYPAEDDHQQYLEKRGQSSCHVGLKPESATLPAEPQLKSEGSLWQRLLKTASSNK